MTLRNAQRATGAIAMWLGGFILSFFAPPTVWAFVLFTTVSAVATFMFLTAAGIRVTVRIPKDDDA